MAELKTIICDTSYDEDLLKIKNFKLHKELLPFIGYNYKKIRLLLVGESHYVKRGNLTDENIINLYKDWYNKPTEFNENAIEYRAWFTTRNVIRNFQCRNRGKAHTMFSNPGKAIMEVLGDKCPTDSAAFSCIAFCNYFQRPSLSEGESISLIYQDEDKITAEIFEDMIDVIKPNGIIFLSKKAYDSYINFRNKEYPILIDFVHHPTSSWWNKDKGKEKFIKIMEELLSKIFLKTPLPDERIWLMRKLFNDMEKIAIEMGYDVKTCPDYYIVDYYLEGRDLDRLPYVEINDGDKEVKIEIDSRLYFWKNEKEWEYLSLDNKMGNSQEIPDTPNFRGSSQVYKDLFDENFREGFVKSSLDYIAETIN